MAQAVEAVQPIVGSRPRLVFFHYKLSGKCRRVEGFIAQVLQRSRNHGTFVLHQVDVDEHPELLLRFQVAEVPTLVVVDAREVRGRLVNPRGCREIEDLLAPWLK